MQLRNGTPSFRARGAWPSTAAAARRRENPRERTRSDPRAEPERQLPKGLAVKLRDLLLSVAALAVLVALLALADDRVRERVTDVSAHAVSHSVAEGTTQVQAATLSARNLVVEKGALTALVIAGGVLFVFMLRT